MNDTLNTSDRVLLAEKYFRKGYNCAQSVTVAFADLYGLSVEQALRLSASFGGGLGRMRLTCGAVSGMCILLGLETGSTDASNRMEKAYNYEMVQKLTEQFRNENGSIICSELLGLKHHTPDEPMPAERTPSYYKKRPCVEMVKSAARIYANFLNNKSIGEKTKLEM